MQLVMRKGFRTDSKELSHVWTSYSCLGDSWKDELPMQRSYGKSVPFNAPSGSQKDAAAAVPEEVLLDRELTRTGSTLSSQISTRSSGLSRYFTA